MSLELTDFIKIMEVILITYLLIGIIIGAIIPLDKVDLLPKYIKLVECKKMHKGVTGYINYLTNTYLLIILISYIPVLKIRMYCREKLNVG